MAGVVRDAPELFTVHFVEHDEPRPGYFVAPFRELFGGHVVMREHVATDRG